MLLYESKLLKFNINFYTNRTYFEQKFFIKIMLSKNNVHNNVHVYLFLLIHILKII